MCTSLVLIHSSGNPGVLLGVIVERGNIPIFSELGTIGIIYVFYFERVSTFITVILFVEFTYYLVWCEGGLDIFNG